MHVQICLSLNYNIIQHTSQNMDAEFQPFTITCYTFCDRFQQIRMTQWQLASFPRSPDIAHTTLGSVQLCLSLNDIDCLCVWWNEILPPSFNISYTSKGCLHLIKNIFSWFLSFLLLFYMFVSGISYFSEPNIHITLKMNSTVPETSVCDCL